MGFNSRGILSPLRLPIPPPGLWGVSGGWGRDRTGVHGFANRCMTILPPSLNSDLRYTQPKTNSHFCPSINSGQFLLRKNWSGKRGSNSRPQPWQGCALPLSYSRNYKISPRILIKQRVLSSKPLTQ